jgi:FAD/FMN-containing dehydrogenase
VESISETVLKKLQGIVAEQFASDNKYIRYSYSANVDPVLRGVPDVVVRPGSAEEIAEILKVANDEGIKVTPRGGGCCEFGGSKPIGDGGVVLDLKRMAKILDINEDNMSVTVEAGISWGTLNAELAKQGLYTGCMGPGSGMVASVGGGISHNSVGGGGCAKYGACTKQLLGLEVALPTGELIQTGSLANKFNKVPFGRFGNGPDLAGLFCGDNGILGVKTKVMLQIFPRPPFANYKTFNLRGDTAKSGARIMQKVRRVGIDVYDLMYLPDIVTTVLSAQDVFKPWKNISRLKGMMFYTVEANSEPELAEKTKQLDTIMEEEKAQDIGPEISDGNIAKWHYVEQGHWQLYHPLWGVTVTSQPLTAECFSPIKAFPGILSDLDAWEGEHKDEMDQIAAVAGARPMVGSGPVMLLGESNVEITCGFTTYPHKELHDINLTLWRSILENVTRHGVQWYMMGDFCSRAFVEMGAYQPDYYSLLANVKKLLDPRNVLSPGKFKLGEGGEN